MQRTLEDFIRALRTLDVKVSPAEAIDAHRAAMAVGYGERALFKEALCATLAKSADEVETFDACFDRFFARAAPSDSQQQAASEGTRDSGDDLEAMMLNGDAAGLAQAMEAAAEAADVRGVRYITQRRLFARRMLDAMGIDAVERRILDLSESGEADDRARAEALRAARRRLIDDARAYMERQYDLFARADGQRLRQDMIAERPMRGERIDPAEFALMRAVVKRMAKRLASQYGRKRRAAKRGALDMRRTLRAAAPHGGIAFDIFWRRKHVEKPKLVVLVDVSRSVRAASHFLLLFLYSLNEIVERLDAFAFSGRLAPVGDILDAESAEAAIERVIAEVGWSSTDYGQALDDFEAGFAHTINKRTTVLILGDARSNYSNPRADLMKAIAARARALIFLNPEPESFWGQGDSVMPLYARFAHEAKTCASLKDLERIVEDVLRAYIKP